MQTQKIAEQLFDDTEEKEDAKLPVAFLEYDLYKEHKKIELFNGETTIGRIEREGFGPHIIIPHPTISAIHARLTVLDGRFLVADLSSTNGTMVNQIFLTERFIQYEVKENDCLKFGDLKCWLSSRNSTVQTEIGGLLPTLCFFPPLLNSKAVQLDGPHSSNKHSEYEVISESSLYGSEKTKKKLTDNFDGVRDFSLNDGRLVNKGSEDDVNKMNNSTSCEGSDTSSKRELLSILVENRQKRRANILTPVEPSSNKIYDFVGLGAESGTTFSESNEGMAEVSSRVEENLYEWCNEVVPPEQYEASSHNAAVFLKDALKRSEKVLVTHDKEYLRSSILNSRSDRTSLKRKFSSNCLDVKQWRKRSSLTEFSNIRVFFLSGFSEEQIISMTKKIQQLGAQVTRDIHNATHVVAVKVRRTTNFVCAVARRLPIVSGIWIDDCVETRTDNWKKHLLLDPIGEKRAGVVVKSIYKEPLVTFLSGFKIYATPNVIPKKDQVKTVLDCVGAQLVAVVPKEKEKSFVVTSQQDYDSNDIKMANKFGVPVIECKSLFAAICCNSVEAFQFVVSNSV